MLKKTIHFPRKVKSYELLQNKIFEVQQKRQSNQVNKFK